MANSNKARSKIDQGKTVDGLDRVAVVAGLRTPFARQSSFFKRTSTVELGQMVVSELINREQVPYDQIDRVVYGQVSVLPETPNIAREIILGTGLPPTIDAFSVSRACATGFQAAVCVMDAIQVGDIDVGIAGGADSASVVPVQASRKLSNALVDLSKAKTGAQKFNIFKSLSLKDLAPVPPSAKEFSTGLRMGDTAEQMAKSYGITREQQDQLAHRSHTLAAKAWDEGLLDDEVMRANVPPFKDTLSRDENIRFDSTLEGYKKLKPAFDRQYGTVTAANSTPLTDGASAVILMRESRARELGYTPLGFIKAYAFTANQVEKDMLIGPAYAIPKVLKRVGLQLSDMTTIDIHEAFAAQTLSVIKLLESKDFGQSLGFKGAIGEVDDARFNPLGSSMAYGHPFAATGGRMITQSLRELQRRGGGMGMISACASGGLAVAMIVEAE